MAGRPTKYKDEYCDQAAKLCRLGATDVEIADFFEVNVATVYRWKLEHEGFCEALKTAKAEADERVKNSLYHKAIGYSFDSEKVFQHHGEVIRVPIREHVPPSDTACIFWLKNRQPEDWRDRHEHTGAGGGPIEHKDVSDQDRLAALATLIAKAGKQSAGT